MPEHKKLIWDALGTVASYSDKSFRRMTNLVNAVQSVELKTALQPLTISGAYGEIFDSDEDSLELSSWQTFEMEKLMTKRSIEHLYSLVEILRSNGSGNEIT